MLLLNVAFVTMVNKKMTKIFRNTDTSSTVIVETFWNSIVAIFISLTAQDSELNSGFTQEVVTTTKSKWRMRMSTYALPPEVL